MRTIASLIRTVMGQALTWTVLAGATLVMGQAAALAEDAVAVSLSDHLVRMREIV